jgi:protein SCO1/2
MALGLPLALACAPGEPARVVGAESGAVDIKVARPAVTLRDTDGRPFDFGVRTRGRLTFLEFGYTHCPDVCPVHMANLAAVMARLTPSDRMRISVVFVSIDPDRDSAAVLRNWLDAFDPAFIGLTGTREQLDSLQRAVGFAPAVVQAAAPGGQPEVIHAAPVLAFTADDTAHVMYPFGTRQSDWARDIPRLLAWRAARSAVNAPPAVTAERAFLVAPAGASPAALYLVLRNAGAVADTLVSISAGTLGAVELHESVHDHATNRMQMRPVPGIAVPAQGAVALAPGGYHAMVGPLARRVARGDQVPITLRFARGAEVTVVGTVIAYADVDTATAPRPR